MSNEATMFNASQKLLLLLVSVSLALSACTRGGPAPTSPPASTATLPAAAPSASAPAATAAATTAPSETPLPTATLPAPQFIGSACPFTLPAGLTEGEDIRCGYVSVPANRNDPTAGTLQLATAILTPADGSTAADPLIYLEGGPGGSALEFLYLTYDRNFKPILESGRQIVIFDQRGVGLSRPALDCTELNRLFLELLNNEMNGQTLTDEEMDALNTEAIRVCSTDLAGRADLAGFSTDENAADVVGLTQALGFDQVNLWGVSYGTRLALEVMRDHPEIVRAAILDSNVPPDANLYAGQPPNLVRAFSLLFDSCAADPACNQAYPDLKKTFFDTVARLDQQPATFSATDALTGKSYEVVVNGDNLMDLLFQFLYDADVLPILPRLIANVSAGNYDMLSLLVGSVIATRSAISHGMHFALQCKEEVPFTSPDEVAAAAGEFAEYQNYFDDSFIQGNFDACEAMAVEPLEDPSVNQAVESDIPSLVMAGEFDPVTPPAWSEQVAATLENSYLYEFPALSHGASFKPGCPQEILLAFLEDPLQKPDAACLDAMNPPQWVLPISADVTMEPFTNEQMGVQGRKPAGWEEVSPGVYSRKSSSLDMALLLAQSAPSDAQTLLTQLSRQFGLQSAPESSGEVEANGLTWAIYSMTVRNLPVTMAIAQAGDRSMVVLLQSASDEHTQLVDNVFNPVIASMQPAP